jgi:hypothetical protein
LNKAFEYHRERRLGNRSPLFLWLNLKEDGKIKGVVNPGLLPFGFKVQK